MNQVTQALRDAFADSAIGEEVTFRGVKVTGRVDRSPSTKTLDKLCFDESTKSVVALPYDTVEPTAGEVITDSFNRYHRIQQVSFNGVCWFCGCAISSDPT